ncbi:MAG: DNA-protecting protein DprA [Nitrospinaceae bacterium]|nr:DNA-protecting protein DprA [Nitrospinaceae bacterium]MBT3822193.1 DNA-protecting protein DprA [Nitrospinaceae bacterium]MBT4092887.1 DNA-protecting protein DprA [Nitrospinaceae bacterium]MBT4429971.1 DNA-protecting protein DprA [Nitrospinaceae bacterium]MBT5366761.1 DNA-protecting protein DprA [Nitrospinaceae bacterium]
MQVMTDKIHDWGRGIPEVTDAWLVLQTLPGMTPERLHRIIEIFQDPVEALRAPDEELARLAGKKALEYLKRESPSDQARKLRSQAQKDEVSIFCRNDVEYPDSLQNIYAPPGALFVKGRIEPRDTLAVAIVGMRTPSPYGKRMARELSGALAERGITVVSGLARGIDKEAHEAALEVGGRTIAILGCGLNINYPAGHTDLRRDIAKSGAVITELTRDAAPRPENFPRRNRLISGLSLATVVVEAAQRSGALLTARLAMEQGRELMAVPGPVDSGRSSGCHRILKEGAHLVETADDIINALPAYVFESLDSPPVREISEKSIKDSEVRPSAADTTNLSAEETIIFEQLENAPNTTEGLTKSTKLRPEAVSNILLNLELQGLLRQTKGGLYERS